MANVPNFTDKNRIVLFFHITVFTATQIKENEILFFTFIRYSQTYLNSNINGVRVSGDINKIKIK